LLPAQQRGNTSCHSYSWEIVRRGAIRRARKAWDDGRYCGRGKEKRPSVEYIVRRKTLRMGRRRNQVRSPDAGGARKERGGEKFVLISSERKGGEGAAVPPGLPQWEALYPGDKKGEGGSFYLALEGWPLQTSCRARSPRGKKEKGKSSLRRF